MNDLIILAFAVIMLLAVLPLFLMSRAFKGAGRRKDDGGDISVTSAMAAGCVGHPGKSKARHDHDDSGSDGGGDGGDGGGGGD